MSLAFSGLGGLDMTGLFHLYFSTPDLLFRACAAFFFRCTSAAQSLQHLALFEVEEKAALHTSYMLAAVEIQAVAAIVLVAFLADESIYPVALSRCHLW